MSDKVKGHHIGRKALLYVRQSSVYQVIHNVESQKLQYAMQQRLDILGWREIEVIDEDLGCSAAGTVTRSGFERMVAQVCMGQVGAVAAREVSRFARNSRELKPIQFDLKFPDLPIQFVSQLLVGFIRTHPSRRKCLRREIQQLFLPVRDLIRMDGVA